jgi:hypothetical protein
MNGPTPEEQLISAAPTVFDVLTVFLIAFVLVGGAVAFVVWILRRQVAAMDRELQEGYAAWVDERPQVVIQTGHAPTGECAGCRELFGGEPRQKPTDEHRHDAWPTR